MKWYLAALIAAACMFISSEANAQATSSECRERTVAGETVLACPDGLYERLGLSGGNAIAKIDVDTQDLRSCRSDAILGVSAIRCSDGLFEWRRVGGRLRLKTMEVLSSEEADRRLRVEALRQQPAPVSRYGVPNECYVNINRYTDYCINMRERRTEVVHCTGPYSGRYVESATCIRWRNQNYGYRYY